MLDPRRFALARQGSARIGRQIIAERRQRVLGPRVAIRAPLAPLAQPAVHWVILPLGILAFALLLMAVATTLLGDRPGAPGGAEGDATLPVAVAGTAPAATDALIGESRGVTSPDLVRPSATPVVVVVAIVVATGAPAPPNPAGPPRAGTPGSGGTGGGVPVRTTAPTPAPSADLFPPRGITADPVPPGFQRFQGVVVDANGGPLGGVCVSEGPRGCQPISDRSVADGTWSRDLPAGDGTLIWEFHFEKAGYQPVALKLRPASVQGVSVVTMVPAR